MKERSKDRGLRRLWQWWHEVDAVRGLWETLRSWGWLLVAALSYGTATLTVLISIILVAVGWLVDWGPYVVGPAALVLATAPNYMMWRARGYGPAFTTPIAQSESLVLARPINGDVLISPVEVRGYANVMEGNVIVWEEVKDKWHPVGTATAAMGEQGHLFGFRTSIELDIGPHHLKVCADPAMSDERAGDEDCVQVDVVVIDARNPA